MGPTLLQSRRRQGRPAALGYHSASATMTANNTGPPLPRRMLALAGYLGLAPWLGFFRASREDPFLRHHRAQALSLLLGLAPLLLLGLAGLLAATHLFTSEDWLFDLELTMPILKGANLALGLLAAGWAVAWLAAMGLALAGSTRRAPFVRGERSRWVQRLAAFWSGSLGVAALLLTGFGLYASHVARSFGAPAPVYLLFDPRGYEVFGSWGPKMMFYPVARQAVARWGTGGAVVAPLGRDSFRQALVHGRFLVLFVHGMEGEIRSAGLTIEPPEPWRRKELRYLSVWDAQREESEVVNAGTDLQFLYITGCRTGRRGYGWHWQRGLAPAEVVTFDRMTGGLEHLWWLWSEAPRRLRRVR